MMARTIILLFMTLAQATITVCDTRVPPTEPVSLIGLIATPEKYDGKTVQVIGFLRLEFEGNALYVHEEDYKSAITKNAVWVVANGKIKEQAETLNMHYVELVGTFDASNHGHMGLFSGALSNIRVASTWRPRPLQQKP